MSAVMRLAACGGLYVAAQITVASLRLAHRHGLERLTRAGLR